MPPPMKSADWRYLFRVQGLRDIRALEYDALCSNAGPPVIKVVDGKQCDVVRTLPQAFAVTMPAVPPFALSQDFDADEELMALSRLAKEAVRAGTARQEVLTIDHSIPVWCSNLWQEGCEFSTKE
jgi:hypothetical protein